MLLKWGFTVKGGLVEKLLAEHSLHEATIAYTLNPGVKRNLLAKNAAISEQLQQLGVLQNGGE